MKQLLLLSMAFFMISSFTGCSKDDVIIDNTIYPLDNEKFYVYQDGENKHEIHFVGGSFVYSSTGNGITCKYSYTHPIVTLDLNDGKTVKLIVREKEFIYTDENGKEYVFVETTYPQK